MQWKIKWIVNSTPHTSHFSQCCTTNDTHTRGSSRKFGVRTLAFHASSSCAHVVCLILFDFSTFLSLLSIFSPIVLSFLLAINFIFHDVVGKFPVHFSLWGPWHSCRVRPSHRLWAQRLRHLGGYWTVHPGMLRQERVFEWPRVRWRHHRHCALFTTVHSRSEKMMRAVDELITLMTKVCRPVSRCLSVIERGDPLWNSLTHKLPNVRKSAPQLRKWANQDSFGTTKRADPHWLSSRDSKTRVPGRLWQKKYSKVEWNDRVSKRRNFIVLIKEDERLRRDQQLLHEQLLAPNRDLHEAHEKSLNEMEELKRFQGSTFDTISRRKLSKIETLSLNSQARFRNYRMKSIVWTIREIFKMLNQYAVDNPTFPVNLCLSHLIQFLVECWAVLWECRAAEKGRQVFGTHTGISGNVFVNPTASSSAPYPQESNPWSSNISEHTSPHCDEWKPNTSSGSEMPVRTVSQKFSHP